MKQALQVVTRHFGSLVLLALSGVAVGADNCDPENGKKGRLQELSATRLLN
ncbi:hypothetical protein [Pseudomonas sp. JY-Q]|uniref:hypothetical protein n=1 Tax=Pseudomonas sp. JY-Q TaxID=1338689 RepID=UPI0012EA8307|nr:hypothetical protein [Pseudomonas sp. JY-Q]